MTFIPSAKYFLVQKLGISNKEAISLIREKQMLINGSPATIKQPVFSEDRIELDGCLLKFSKKYVYLAYYKPRGVETTLNRNIAHNLADTLNFPSRIFPLGRLDKESEGLLILTNNGAIYNKIVCDKQGQEKEYEVTVNKMLSEEALFKIASGIKVLGKITRPAKVTQLSSYTFRIVLTQGINRQIRRMCYKLEYDVLTLKRTRIVTIHLDPLLPGEWRYLTEKEVNDLIKLPDFNQTL